jgi:hypothetical protein
MKAFKKLYFSRWPVEVEYGKVKHDQLAKTPDSQKPKNNYQILLD